MKDFGIILNNHNLKATPQRLEMLSIINKTGHINIDDLYVKVKDKYDSISLATIYKNINAMITNMQLLEVKIPNNKSVYEIVKEEHSHLVCKNRSHLDTKNGNTWTPLSVTLGYSCRSLFGHFLVKSDNSV
ncbi:MAG: transcriptional repressor, partial [Campylobacterota bacterium]|nr:transcriptional repressor [Campylobacterota bacterium]